MKNPKSLYILSAIIIMALVTPAVLCTLWLKNDESSHSTSQSSGFSEKNESGGMSNGQNSGEAVKGEPSGSSEFVVLIDPGHGGYDPGKVSPDGVNEKDINLAISQKLRGALTAAGCQVYMTRETDTSLNSSDAANKKNSDLRYRTHMAEEVGADLYLSIHQNSYSAEYVHGAQVFYYSTSAGGKALAECIQRHLISDADPSNTRAAKGNSEYIVLAESPCTALIIECGFLSNAEECRRLGTEDYQSAIAAAIAAAVTEWRASQTQAAE